MKYKFKLRKVADYLFEDPTSGLLYVRKAKRGLKPLNRSTGTKNLEEAIKIRDELIRNHENPTPKKMPKWSVARDATGQKIKGLILSVSSGTFYVKQMVRGNLLFKSLGTKDQQTAEKRLEKVISGWLRDLQSDTPYCPHCYKPLKK